MILRDHWERVYETKSPQETSWFQPHLETSLRWIAEAAPGVEAAVVDVGGGESTLVDDLLARGYQNLTVVDIAGAALRKSQIRLGGVGARVRWVEGDVLEADLPARAYELWHDRAVFHFFTDAEKRAAYVRQMSLALRPGGRVVMATFGPQGPERCSGLATERYSAERLQLVLGGEFELLRSEIVEHRTPFGTTQQFLFCGFKFHGA